MNNLNIPVNINVSMSIIDIIKIEEVDHVYTLKFRLVLEWSVISCSNTALTKSSNDAERLTEQEIGRYDYRIKYFNLKKTRSQNALALEDVHRLWIPFLVFDNTEKNEATKVFKIKHFFLANIIFNFRGRKTRS